MSYVLKFHALHIERRFADAILDGRKVWEFRKKPLLLDREYMLCLADENDRVVGSVSFSHVVGTYRGILFNILRDGLFKPFAKYTGLPKGWLDDYAKDYESVYAHLVGSVSKFTLSGTGVFKGSCMSFRSETRGILESLKDAVHEKVLANRMSRHDLLSARLPL